MNAVRTEIAITGLAAISSAGVGLDPLKETLVSGISALRPVPLDLAGEEGHFWGRAEGFKASDFMPPLKARKFDRCSLFAVVAAGMALQDAGLNPVEFGSSRVGIILGCGFGGIANSEEFLRGYFTKGTDGLVPMLFPNTVPNAPASNASIEHGMKGPNVTFVQRFCSAESAFQMACRFLDEDRADIMLTGGVDELDPFMIEAFRDLGQLRGYAAGFSEGAGILVLEKGAIARSRGARIRATAGDVRTVGRLLPGRESEGIDRIIGTGSKPQLVSLSGVAGEMQSILERLPDVPRLETGRLLGRSLAMGGLSLVSLLLTIPSGGAAVHYSASPEGPYYGIDFSA
ncbi:MAG: beta-ketoacyl synthase N-terminal-like domain-containing protein [Geobacteraceae bacterium]|nr:beta-ketoacyl synthase N-terminal-like domain-containing protein [Geobacteraceae bacterium]